MLLIHASCCTLQAEDYSDSHETHLSPASLQSLCLIASIDNLEYYPPELLACLPLAHRYQLLVHCPIVDVCRLEKTSVFDDIETERLWGRICDKLWEKGRFENYFESYMNGEMFTENRHKEMLPNNVPSRDKCFMLITTAILCAERPTGLFYDGREYPCSRDTIPHEWLKRYSPADIVNYLVCTDDLKEQLAEEQTDDDYYPTSQKSIRLEDNLEDYFTDVNIEYIFVAYKN